MPRYEHDIAFRVLADAQDFVSTMTDAERAELGLVDATDLLRKRGIETTDAIHKELVVLEALERQLKGDALATAQVVERKDQLVRRVRQLTTDSGGMTRSLSAANGVTLELGRAAQDMAFGWVGVINNFQAASEAGVRLAQSTGSVRGAVGSLAASLKGPNGILLLMSLATSAFLIYERQAQKTKRETEKVKNELDGVASALIKIKEASKTTFTAQTVQDAKDLAAEYERQKEALEAQLEAVKLRENFQVIGPGAIARSALQQPVLTGTARTTAQQDLADYVALLEELRKTIKQYEAEERLTDKTRKASTKGIIETNDETEKTVTLLEKEIEARRELARQVSEAIRRGQEIAAVQRQNIQLQKELDAILRNAQRRSAGTLVADVSPLDYQFPALTDKQGRPARGDLPFLLPDAKALQPRKFVTATRGEGELQLGVVEVIGQLRTHAGQIGNELDRINDNLGEKMFESLERFDELAKNLSDTIRGGLVDSISTFAGALPGLATGTQSFTGLVSGLVGDFAQNMGRTLIGFGVSGIAIQTFHLNPYAAIAAGAALVGLGAALKQSAQQQTDQFTGGASSSGAPIFFQGGSTTSPYSGGYAAAPTATNPAYRVSGPYPAPAATAQEGRAMQTLASLTRAVDGLVRNGVGFRREVFNKSAEADDLYFQRYGTG